MIDDAQFGDAALTDLAARVGAQLLERGARVATAESCTGGWIAKCLTDRPGSSAWFEFGFVSYADSAKTRLLGVAAASIRAHGAVSREVVESMAQGARLASGAEIAVAVSGIAGPDGGSIDKPVGTVWLAWDAARTGLSSRCEHFAGSRDAVRRQTVAAALHGVLERL